MDQQAAAAARPYVVVMADVEPTQDFDHAMRLLKQWRRRDGSLGPRFVRREHLTKWPFAKAFEALERRLALFGYRCAGPD